MDERSHYACSNVQLEEGIVHLHSEDNQERTPRHHGGTTLVKRCLVDEHKCSGDAARDNREYYTPIARQVDRTSERNDQRPSTVACRGQEVVRAETMIKGRRQMSDNDVTVAIFAACRYGRLDIVKLLAESGHQICLKEVRNKEGRGLLHCACEGGWADVVNYLVAEQGCDLDARDCNGKTPLQYTCDIDVAQSLIPYLPNYERASDNLLHEALFFACKVGCLDLVKKAMHCHPCKISPNIRDTNERSPLHHASIGGHTEIVKWLAVHTVSLPDKYGLTPLHYACLYGYKDIIRVFRKRSDSVKDSFVERSISQWKTAEVHLSDMLSLACEVGHLGVVKYMIEELEFNPNTANKVEQTPLHLACRNRCIVVVDYLVRLPACTPDSSEKVEVLVLACEVGSLALIKVVVEEYQWNPNVTNESQQTLIYVACLSGHYDIIHYLISLPNYKPINDKYFVEALLRACKEGHLDIVKTAIQEGKCDPLTLRDRFQRTFLHCSCQYGHLDMVRYLVEECGCNPDVRDEDKRAPLHSAALSGHADVAEYLIGQQNSDVNVRTQSQRTPIHYACLKGHMNVVMCLTSDKKCNPGVGDDHQRTPLHFACQSGNVVIVHHLIKKIGCLPSIKDGYGRTPLHYACLYGHNDIIEYLIARKCRPDERDKDHNTPLHCACYKKWFDSVKHLLKVTDKLKINTENKQRLTPFEMIKSNAARHQILCLLFEKISITDEEIVQLIERFITRGIWDPNQTDKNGENALHLASRAGRNEIIHYLLTKTSCNVNYRNKNGETPLMLVTSYNTVNSLIQHGAEVRSHQIVSANWTEERIVQTMMYLIQHRQWDPNQMCDGGNALHFACEANRPLIANYLLSEGVCDPNTKNDTGSTPLRLTQNQDIMINLITHGVVTLDVYTKLFHDTSEEVALRVIKRLTVPCILWNPSEATSDGDISLHHACMVNRTAMVHFLLAEMKCDANVKNGQGMTPLDLTSNPAIICHLVRHGADMECVYRKLTCVMTEELGLEAIAYLFSSGELNQRTKECDNILQFACRAKQSRIVEYLLCETSCALNQNGEFPLHSMQIDIANVIANATEHRALQVVAHITTESQAYHHNGMTVQGVTALHLACRLNKRRIVKYLLSEANYCPNIMNAVGEMPLNQARDPKIIKELIRHGANSPDVYKTHGKVFGPKSRPLKPSVKVFIVGNPAVGKSTLVAALQTELSLVVRPFKSKKVTSVDEHTAGVVPHEYESKRYQCGLVTLYDFAGQREFYSSHAALLQTSVQSTPPIFLLLINLCDTDRQIEQNVQYWLTFISNSCSSVSSKPHVIVIGSHADIFKARGGDEKQVMKSVETQFIDHCLIFAGLVTMDCRCFESADMAMLGGLLSKSCDCVRQQELISFNSHCFHSFLLSKFCDKIAVQLKDIRSLLICNNIQDPNQKLRSFIPSNLLALSRICSELNDRDHILFLRDHENIERSWIIIKKAAMLSQVTGTIFAPKGFKQHSQLASSTGVVPLSKLTNHFPNHDPKMLVGFLSHLEYCHEIADQEVLQLIEDHHRSTDVISLPNERYLFFPGLITLNVPDKVWSPEADQFNHVSGWIMQCTRPEQFFTSRFLQVLILRLAFCFALAPSAQEKDDSFPAIQRRCSVWKSGIFWGSQDGLEVLVEVLPSTKAVALLIRGRENSLFKYIELRS